MGEFDDFEPITHDGDWHMADSLGGLALEDGERIEALWPDGEMSRHNVHLETKLHPNSNGQEPRRVCRAYVVGMVHGVQCRVFFTSAYNPQAPQVEARRV